MEAGMKRWHYIPFVLSIAGSLAVIPLFVARHNAEAAIQAVLNLGWCVTALMFMKGKGH